MATFNALWIDDIRDMPADDDQFTWTCARSFHEAITKLELLDFDLVSFDHDLGTVYGERELTGYDIALWLAQRKHDGFSIPTQYQVHSANPVGRDRITGVIKRYLGAA